MASSRILSVLQNHGRISASCAGSCRSGWRWNPKVVVGEPKLSRHFATSSSSVAATSRIVLTLYRNLLQWCRDTDSNIPLKVPPVYLVAPSQIDPYRMEVLAQSAVQDEVVQYVRSLLPSPTVLRAKNMTVPIQNSRELRHFFRAIFRLNAELPTEESFQKTRISLAFDALKSLNQLSTALTACQEERQAHLDRTNVEFKVGQVVRHQHDRWRGVIAGWDKLADSTTDPEEDEEKDVSTRKKTSVTTKQYSTEGVVQYTVLLDAGDAHRAGLKDDEAEALQSDLELVRDAQLMRIRNNDVTEYFDRFDPVLQSFVPTPLQAYKYPLDMEERCRKRREVPLETKQLCTNILHGVQTLAEKLDRIILDETSCPSERGLSLLASIQTRLQSIQEGVVTPKEMQLATKDISPAQLAASYLRDLLVLTLEIQDVCWQRKAAILHSSKVHFRVGQVVRHKKYKFRGVVVGWDPKPTIDVSRWDGVQHLYKQGKINPREQPFFHVVPDPNDCIRSFGGERGLRYVCQENLEPCPMDQTDVDIEFQDPEWKRERVENGVQYVAPSQLRFKYGQDDEIDDNATERCLNSISHEINKWQHLACTNSDLGDVRLSHLNMKNMMALLQVCDTTRDATVVQETIKEMRKAHSRFELRWQLELGMTDLMAGKGQQALDAFKAIVMDDPNYVEAWNKRATCEFMLGKYEDSIESTRVVLNLDPNHFNALNGLGLIHFQKGEYQEAVDCFRQSVHLDPWSPVASKLSLSIDLISHRVMQDEIST